MGGLITDSELAAKTESASSVGDTICGNPPSIVIFPNVARQRIDTPLKLEVADSADDMSPRNMWQVYAIGGFMVGSWIWAKFKERRGRS